jgi:hypothetical protein
MIDRSQMNGDSGIVVIDAISSRLQCPPARIWKALPLHPVLLFFCVKALFELAFGEGVRGVSLLAVQVGINPLLCDPIA